MRRAIAINFFHGYPGILLWFFWVLRIIIGIFNHESTDNYIWSCSVPTPWPKPGDKQYPAEDMPLLVCILPGWQDGHDADYQAAIL